MKRIPAAILRAEPSVFCAHFQACYAGREFATKYLSMAEVWDHCENPHWLLWILARTGYRRTDRKALIAWSAWCARSTPLADGRTTWDLLTDPRSRAAVAFPRPLQPPVTRATFPASPDIQQSFFSKTWRIF